jgi:nitrous oxidase accessory protein
MLKNKFIHNWGASAYGLLLKDIRDSYILGNDFKTNTVGIHAEGCSRSLIFGNDFENNGYALRLQADCDDNKIRFNNFILNSFDLITNGFTVLNELKYNYWDKYQGYDLKRDGIGDQAYRPMNLFGSIIEKNPVSILFLKSLLADLLDKLEKIIPGITPENLQDVTPLIHRINHAKY